MNNKKVYGMAIKNDEFYDLLLKGDLRIDQLVNCLKSYKSFLGVWQEPLSEYQVFVFDNSNDRTECFKPLDEYKFKTLRLYQMFDASDYVR